MASFKVACHRTECSDSPKAKQTIALHLLRPSSPFRCVLRESRNPGPSARIPHTSNQRLILCPLSMPDVIAPRFPPGSSSLASARSPQEGGCRPRDEDDQCYHRPAEHGPRDGVARLGFVGERPVLARPHLACRLWASGSEGVCVCCGGAGTHAQSRNTGHELEHGVRQSLHSL